MVGLCFASTCQLASHDGHVSDRPLCAILWMAMDSVHHVWTAFVDITPARVQSVYSREMVSCMHDVLMLS